MSGLLSLPRALAVVALVATATAGAFVLGSGPPDLDASGPEEGARVGGADAERLAFAARTDRADALAEATLTLNGEDVTADAVVDGDTIRYEPGTLPDGVHELDLRLPGGLLARDRTHRWSFEVDTAPPEITVTEPDGEVPWGEEVVVAGRAAGATEVTVGGEPAELDGDAFRVVYETAPGGEVEIVATDELGNTASNSVEVVVGPREPPGMQGVHITMWGWSDERVREPILDMVRDGLINTVQLDIKDEDGSVGYDSRVELAQASGAARGAYDLEDAIAELRALDVHIVGRIVAFADPRLTAYLWENGERDKVIQTPGGDRYIGRYAGFSNFAHPEIRQYNIDLAVEAAEAGFDDILYDYVRRPDGSLDNMVIPGLEGTPEEGIVQFFAEAREALAPTQAWLGASVYGIAADRPTQIGQDIPGISEHADYVAPMVYPSHWGPGEYGVANPNAQPYDIVHASLQVFQEVMEGTDARIVPWLQDFSLGVSYGPEEVRAQIDAAADLGIEEFLLWNAAARYTRAALE